MYAADTIATMSSVERMRYRTRGKVFVTVSAESDLELLSIVNETCHFVGNSSSFGNSSYLSRAL